MGRRVNDYHVQEQRSTDVSGDSTGGANRHAGNLADAEENKPTPRPTEAEIPVAKTSPDPTAQPTPDSTICVVLLPELQGGAVDLEDGQVSKDGINFYCHAARSKYEGRYPQLGGFRFEAERIEDQMNAAKKEGRSVEEVEDTWAWVALFFKSNRGAMEAYNWLKSRERDYGPCFKEPLLNPEEPIRGQIIIVDTLISLLIPIAKMEEFITAEGARSHEEWC